MRFMTFTAVAATLVAVSTFANAGGHASAKQLEGAAKVRQAHMQLYNFNLATLGSMAKGAIPYDAAAAQAAADNLAALANMSEQGYWLEGSDSDAVEGSRALPAAWATGNDLSAKQQMMADAAMDMQGAAGQGIDGIKGQIGAVGAACGACHKAYRQPK
jgi:cytochrome c556